MSQRARSNSHDSLRQAVKREDISGSEFDNGDGQTPCTLCKLAKEPCSIPTQRSEDTLLSPSECTCNHVFFDIWSACLLTEERLADYGEWVNTCRNHSLDVLEDYPSQWANSVTISSWVAIAVASNSTLDAATAPLVPRSTETEGIAAIVVPIAGVLGLAALGLFLIYLYWIKRGRNGESFRAFLRRCFSLRKAKEIRPMTRSRHFEIDYQSSNADDFVMVGAGDDSLKMMEPEYRFPFKNVWRNSQIIQQFRRIPDVVPHPWGYRPVHIRPKQPGRRFRVDHPSASSTEGSSSSAMNSHSGTVEGTIPDTIFEEDDKSQNRDSYYENERESLISHSERYHNEVFLISDRPTFTVSSHSSESHRFRIVPPTPTDSSRSHGHLSQVLTQVVSQPRRPFDIPPAPQLPPPVPPGTFTRRPSPLHDQVGPSHTQPPQHHQIPSSNSQAQSVPQPPHPSQSVSSFQTDPRDQPLYIQRVPSTPRVSNPFDQNITHADPPQAPIPPQSGNPSQAGPSQYQPPPPNALPTQSTQPRSYPRRPSGDANDPFPRRPMGARLPSHVTRNKSLDGPTIPSGESIHITSPSRPSPRPLTPHSPHAHRRSLSGSGDDTGVPPVPTLPPPRPTHGRTLSSESVTMAPGDSRMLYPGPVRAAGYTVNLPPDAAEPLEAHGRPLPRERTHY
ncbi:hypothetical protein C0995_015697 [Termitomyces sp. Mi166|nr:hypothetical protein C0995_015697 [Termitomyces sp. Mi166\